MVSSSSEVPMLVPQPKSVEVLDAAVVLGNSVRLELVGEVAAEEGILAGILRIMLH